MLNHTFLCIDVDSRVIRPQTVGWLGNCVSFDINGSGRLPASYRLTGLNERLVDTSSSHLPLSNTRCNHDATIIDRQSPQDCSNSNADVSYIDLGDCDLQCEHCGSLFWYNEMLKIHNYTHRPQYHLCCGGGRIYLHPTPAPSEFIRQLLSTSRFMDHIRAYNQIFAMTSFGAKVDDSVNKGRGPYVFKVSGQVYHWIGSFCPEDDDPPRFLQLYIYDTHDEVNNRLHNFSGSNSEGLSAEIIEGLIHVL